MIYEQNCYNLNIKYFDNLIEVNIKKISNNIEKFKMYENILQISKLNRCNILIKYFGREFVIYNEQDLKMFLRSCSLNMLCSDSSRCKNFELIEIDGVFICKNCNAVFYKSLRKVVIRCCKKD